MASRSASGNVTARMTRLPHGPFSFYRLTIGGNWSPAIVSRGAASGIALILNSRTYQLSSASRPAGPRNGEQNDSRFYSHYYARRLPAEVLLDALSQSTGVPDRFPGYPAGTRAGQLPDPALK